MAVISNLSVDQGATFTAEVAVSDNDGAILDLTGYTAEGQIRKTYTSSTSIDFTAAIEAPTTGNVNISLSAAQTGAMKPGRYVYDVEITNDGGTTVTRILEGQVEVTPSVTR